MDAIDLKALKRKLSYFLRRFYGSIPTVPSRRHFRTYIQGQLSNLERKSIEPMALAAGVPPRSLQESPTREVGSYCDGILPETNKDARDAGRS